MWEVTRSANQEMNQALRSAATHARAGDWQREYAAYGDVFELAVRARQTPAMVRALVAQAWALQCWGHEEQAEELAEMALQVARGIGAPREVARAANVMGAIHHAREEWTDAARLYTEALETARSACDDELIAAICQNLGVVANAMGDLREARALYLEAICACVRCGNSTIAGSTYNNLGMVCADMGDWMEAEIHFLRGLEIAERIEDRPLLARMATGQAEPLIQTGEYKAAEATLERAEALALQLNDRVVITDIYRYRGMIARLTGRYDLASAHLKKAAESAAESSLVLEQAEVMEETARLRWAQGRVVSARALIRAATIAFRQLGARSDLERVETKAKQWRAHESVARADQGMVSPPSTATY